jgi:hypothetical protein
MKRRYRQTAAATPRLKPKNLMLPIGGQADYGEKQTRLLLARRSMNEPYEYLSVFLL